MKPFGAYLLGGPVAALVATGFLGYSEHAVVTLTVAARQVQVENVPLSPGLAVSQIQTSVTEQQTVTSAVVQVPASTAAGRVTFMCSPMTSCPNGYTVAAGTILASTAGVQYRTLGAVSFPSCAPSSPVGVSALSAGAAGNAGAGMVVYGQFPSYIHINYASAMVGGADVSSLPVVQQSDIDAASRTLTEKVSAELSAKLPAQAAGLAYLTTDAPAISSTSDARVGDNVATFTVTVTGTIHALAYSAPTANAALRHALARTLPSGYRLTADPIKATYSVSTTGELIGSASGSMVPGVNSAALAASVRGESPSEAKSTIDHAVPGAAADIRVGPLALPWLPMLADHISVLVVVRGAA